MGWKYTDEQRNIVYRVNADGSMESCIADREDVVWVAQGGVIEEPEESGLAGAEGVACGNQ